MDWSILQFLIPPIVASLIIGSLRGMMLECLVERGNQNFDARPLHENLRAFMAQALAPANAVPTRAKSAAPKRAAVATP